MPMLIEFSWTVGYSYTVTVHAVHTLRYNGDFQIGDPRSRTPEHPPAYVHGDKYNMNGSRLLCSVYFPVGLGR